MNRQEIINFLAGEARATRCAARCAKRIGNSNLRIVYAVKSHKLMAAARMMKGQ